MTVALEIRQPDLVSLQPMQGQPDLGRVRKQVVDVNEITESSGRLVWELVDLSTGQVSAGRRDLGVADFEVMMLPPPPAPQFHLLRLRPRRVVADTLGWLVRGGRGSSTKQVRLARGFWLVLRERRAPTPPSLVLLTARSDRTRLSGGDWFRVNEGGATATQREEHGSAELEWQQDENGFPELRRTTVVDDVVLRLQPARGPIGREPTWDVRLIADSTIQWPSTADGISLVPRLRPHTNRPAE